MHEADFERIQEMVKKDAKSRFHLNSENEDGGEVWWIRANQGHSMQVRTMYCLKHHTRDEYPLQEVKLELQPIQSVSDIPTGIAVHGTTRKAWEIIRTSQVENPRQICLSTVTFMQANRVYPKWHAITYTLHKASQDPASSAVNSVNSRSLPSC